MITVALLAVTAGVAAMAVFWRMVRRPVTVLYLLAFVVSFVGINVHVGATIYLSRLLMLCFLLVLVVRWMLGRDRPRLHCDARIVALFAATIVIQTISAYASDRTPESMRQVFIYLGAMMVFVTVVSLADSSAKVVRAIGFYLAGGIVQGMYGLYQVLGGPRGWPTYQTLLAGIPTANDRTDGGYQFISGYNVYRSIGFFPGDVSHYAGYLAGVLLIALAMLAHRRRSGFLYVVILLCGAGLMFSLSRSGIVAFVGIGLPVLAYFLFSRKMLSKGRVFKATLKWTAIATLVAAVAGGTFVRAWRSDINLPDVGQVLGLRLLNLIQPGDSPEYESMSLHIQTRMIALDAFASSPLIGVGLGVTAKGWYSERYREGWAGAHSHHFNILGQTGALGASLEWTFMALVFFRMRRGVRQSRPRSREQAVMVGLLAAHVTIVVGNFFYAYYTNDFVWFLMGCGWALSVAIRRESTMRETEPIAVCPPAGRSAVAHA